MIIDTLSDTLMKMKIKTLVAGAFDIGGRFAIQLPAFTGFKLYYALKGDRCVSVEGERAKHVIRAGDCFLVTGGKPFVVASDFDVKKRTRLEDIIESKRDGLLTLNGGGDHLSIGTHFEFEGHLPKIIFSRLPSVIHVPGHLDQAALLKWNLERFGAEFRSQNMGRALILNHLAPIMLIQILRIYLGSNRDQGMSWLAALSDPKLSKAIEAMHSHYRRNWSLAELAKLAGMSRSGFAFNFKKKVGLAPMDYLTNWRIQIACDLLKSGENGVADVADAVGYESASAFSVAFHKIVKHRPGAYQRNLKNAG